MSTDRTPVCTHWFIPKIACSVPCVGLPFFRISAIVIFWSGTIGPKFGRNDTSWQDNKEGRQARAAYSGGGGPQPRAVRATLQAHAVLQARPSKEGNLQGCSRDSFKDGAHHGPDAQEWEGVLGMGTPSPSFFIPVRSSSNVLYIRAQVPRVSNC